ncbi:double-stranded DNA binding protein [Salmonella phage STP4-a]|uniref:Double-stranded DNA binding protein n=1 Tax=Salmonella phage STP4-a TaxID=1445860 RepID=A0A0B4L962_9CAUD|nr:transcriptional regulator [Salmonella phage STP4-a]AHJ86832.1 double-stranded DNA binding protein [Salmonella phage STP4-a]
MSFKMAKEKKVAVEFDEAIHGEDLRKKIKEASDHLLKISGYRVLITDLKAAAKDDLGVDSKAFNQLLAMYHKDTREQFEEEKDKVVEIYDSIFTK